MELLIIPLVMVILVAWVAIKILGRIGKITKTLLFGSGRHRAVEWRIFVWMARFFFAGIALVLWRGAPSARPVLALVALAVAWRLWRRYEVFRDGAANLDDAIEIAELRRALAATWEAFPTVTYTDAKGRLHLPTTANWRRVWTPSGEWFGWQAELYAAESSSLGAIDALTAAPGAKDERLASTLNRMLDEGANSWLRWYADQRGLTIPRFAAADVQTTLERIQSVDPSQVPNVISGEGIITLMTFDPLWKSTPLRLREQATRVRQPFFVPVGMDRWGQEVAVPVSRTRIMARSGWGKSVMLDTYLATLLMSVPRRRMIVILIDCKWGMHHVRWAPAVDVLVTNPTAATEVCAAVHAQMQARADYLISRGLEQIEEATEDFPMIVVIADEAQKLPMATDQMRRNGTKLAMDHFTAFYQEGRALGIYPVMALQYGTSKTFPRDIAMNIEVDIAGKLRDRSGANVAMGDDVVDGEFGPHRIVDTPLNKGVFAVKTAAGFGAYIKVFNTTPANKAWVVEHTSPERAPSAWLPVITGGTDEHYIEITEDQEAALTELAEVLLVDVDQLLDDIGGHLDKARRRMKADRHAALAELLSPLSAA